MKESIYQAVQLANRDKPCLVACDNPVVTTKAHSVPNCIAEASTVLDVFI